MTSCLPVGSGISAGVNLRITQLKNISEVPHGVGRLPQSGVQLVHARVHPLEGLHVKQRLEM